nr:hypothetical protein [Tanacetum cinerariifolium]
ATTPIIAATITDAPSAARRRKGAAIRDPEETATPSTIQDEAYAKELEAELNKNINWDDVIEQYFDSNVAFLEKSKEELEEEESRALKKKTESSKEKAVKKQKLDEEVEELKKHLQIVPNDDDDDVYTRLHLLLSRLQGIYTEGLLLRLKTYCCWYKLMLLDNAADIKLRLLEQSAAAGTR